MQATEAMRQETLSLESIEAALKKYKHLIPPDQQDIFSRPHRLFGMDIITAPVKVVPKITLSDACPVSDKFRLEFNDWLLQRFGTRDECPIPLGTAYIFGNRLVMRPESVVMIKNFCA